MVSCPKCGKQNPDQLAVCGSCGTILKTTANIPGAPAPARIPSGSGPVAPEGPPRVILVGMDIPFADLVSLIFKATLAAIPALLLAALLIAFVLALFTDLLRA
jgi:hypothetical protein